MALPWLILLPLAWGTLAFVLGPRCGRLLAVIGIALQTWLVFALAFALGSQGVPPAHLVGGWSAPLGIELAVDGIAAALLLLTQCVALLLALYAGAYYRAGDAAGSHFWPLAGFLLAGLNALFLSADLFNLYVTLELVGLAAVGLVAAGGAQAQLQAAQRYLFATLAGSAMYLFGVALIYGTYGTVSLALLAALITSDAPRLVWIAGALMACGLMLKTALFPLHFWLPPAHGGAPAPVSALLSALVVKASFYLFLRLWIGPFAALIAAAPLVAWLPAALGAMAIVWASLQAIRAERLKVLIAYSTAAQLGYLFLVFPLLMAPGAIQAGIMQLVAHGLAKAAMFCAAGVIIMATGHEAVEDLAGAAERLPLTLFTFGISGMSLIGLPPSAGFLAKWLLIEAALEQGYWWLVVVVLGGGLLAAVYVFRVLRQAMLRAPDEVPLAPVPPLLEWTAFALAVASLLLGLRGLELMRLVAVLA